MPEFKENLYKASLKALTEAGVPIEIAVPASAVVARDQAGLPSLGRTPQDQEDVNEAMRYYHAGQGDAQQ